MVSLIIIFIIFALLLFSNKTKIDQFQNNQQNDNVHVKIPKLKNKKVNKLVNFANNYEINNNHHDVDYIDVITLINNINTSGGKSKFNIGNLFVEKFDKKSIKNKDEIINILNDFIIKFNDSILKMPNERNKNMGWNEQINNKQITSGWDEMRISLGLSPSIYNKPAANSVVDIIGMNDVNVYKTLYEEKIIFFITIKKRNVNKMMFLKIDFVRDLSKHNDLFIDDINILGYGVPQNEIHTDGYTDKNSFYYFDELNKGEFIDTNKISEVLVKKFEEKQMYDENWIQNLDHNDKIVYS